MSPHSIECRSEPANTGEEFYEREGGGGGWRRRGEKAAEGNGRFGGGGTCSGGMSDGGAEVTAGGGAVFATVVDGVAVVALGVFFGFDGGRFRSYVLWKRIGVVVCRRYDDGCGVVVGGLVHRVVRRRRNLRTTDDGYSTGSLLVLLCRMMLQDKFGGFYFTFESLLTSSILPRKTLLIFEVFFRETLE